VKGKIADSHERYRNAISILNNQEKRVAMNQGNLAIALSNKGSAVWLARVPKLLRTFHHSIHE
jgi:outer membrane receptor for Fe3+-dicitrate